MAAACWLTSWVWPALQALNKPLAHLSLEFQRRPNNNDLSVVNVIEMAREPLSASEPRLLMLGLEEMPNVATPDANGAGGDAAGGGAGGDEEEDVGEQLATCELLTQRLRGFCHHPDLLVCLTSNYALAPAAHAALTACKAFANLQVIHVHPLDGSEREALAMALLRTHLGGGDAAGGGGAGGQMAGGGAGGDASECRIELQLSLGRGDVRPLVRHTRTLAVYARHLIRALRDEQQAAAGVTAANVSSPLLLRISEDTSATHVSHDGTRCFDAPITLTAQAEGVASESAAHSLVVVPSAGGSLTPADGRSLHPASDAALTWMGDASGDASTILTLRRVLDLFLLDALAPAVIVCTASDAAQKAGSQLIDALSHALGGGGALGVVRAVDVREVKMNRSLYDPRETRSLRDELLDLKETHTRVAAELLCPTRESELLVREMVEDSPSLVAHSVHKRILHKRALLFLVHVGAHTVEDITPELVSRASVVL
jgi:hypothetical protein